MVFTVEWVVLSAVRGKIEAILRCVGGRTCFLSSLKIMIELGFQGTWLRVSLVLSSHPKLADVLKGIASTALANVRTARLCLDKANILDDPTLM
jgi:hypothetical protein